MITSESRCYRHPDRPAAVGCQRCGKPVCPECMIPASVGFVCPEDAAAGSQVISGREVMNRRPPFVTGMIGLLVVIYLAQVATDASEDFSLTSSWLLYGPRVAAGEYWRIVTSGFIHGGLMHLGFNCYLLWVVGGMLERAIGSKRIALCYFGGLFGGAAAIMAANFDVPTVGASSAVLGLAGAIAGAVRGQPEMLRRTGVLPMIVLNLTLPLLIGRISFWGHFGGVVAGFTLGLLVGRPERADGANATRNEVLAGLVVLVWAGAAVGLALIQ